MKGKSVAIIGSGLSGLLCGYMLSKEGFQVTIFEKQATPGGCLQNFKRQGVTYDTGMHYAGGLGEGQNLNRYLKYFNLLPEIRTVELDPDGFDIISLPTGDYPWASGMDRFAATLSKYFPDEKENLQRFIKSLSAVCQSFPLYNLEVPEKALMGNPNHARSAWEFICDHTSNPILRQVLAGNHFLYDGHQASTPLSQYALVVQSFIQGAFYLLDGSQQIVNSLIRSIQNMGGSILLNHEVTSIERMDHSFYMQTNHSIQPADMVISSIHPAVFLDKLGKDLFQKSFTDRVARAKNSRGCFSIYLKLSPSVFPLMGRNYYCYDDADVWNSRFFMIHTPVFSHSFGFSQTAILLAFMDYRDVEQWKDTTTGNRGSAYEEFKEHTAQQYLTRVAKRFPALSAAIQHHHAATPLTFRDYTGSPEGSMYGVKHDFHTPAASTILPKTKIPGLFFTGQSTNLHGMLGVTISAVKTCGEILGLDYLLKKIRHVTK